MSAAIASTSAVAAASATALCTSSVVAGSETSTASAGISSAAVAISETGGSSRSPTGMDCALVASASAAAAAGEPCGRVWLCAWRWCACIAACEEGCGRPYGTATGVTTSGTSAVAGGVDTKSGAARALGGVSTRSETHVINARVSVTPSATPETIRRARRAGTTGGGRAASCGDKLISSRVSNSRSLRPPAIVGDSVNVLPERQ